MYYKDNKSNKRNCFILKKTRSRWYSGEIITDTVNVYDLALLANTSTQTEYLLHTLEQTAGDTGPNANANKT